MDVLVACEWSETVASAFRSRGHFAVSCDLLPVDSPWHFQEDALTLAKDWPWDLMIAFPPCTYLCSSGLHWNKKRPERAALTEEALEFVSELLNAPIPRIALENPVGCISTRIRKPDQIIQPYEFGEDASKKTCLWLKNLPPLVPTEFVEPRLVNGKPRYGNQTDSGQNALPPSVNRAQLRGKTYEGIARAMADQWGKNNP